MIIEFRLNIFIYYIYHYIYIINNDYVNLIFCYKKIHPLIKIESELVQLIKFGDNRETTTLFLIVICGFKLYSINIL